MDAQSKTGGQSKAGQEPATILIVDDNAQNLELLAVYLEDMPEARTLTATNGSEALECIARQRPDIILLDIMMPRMSGFELCKQLKANPATRDVVVIMVTALNETADIERATECGTDDYLTKPVDRKALVELIRSHLQARRANKRRASRPAR